MIHILQGQYIFAYTTKRVSERHTTVSRLLYSMYFWKLSNTLFFYTVPDGFISPGEVRDVNSEAQLWSGEHPAAAATRRCSWDGPGQ